MKLLTADDWRPLLQAHLAASARPLIAVIGPTASGKTAFSIQLAKAIGQGKGEVVNADSRQLYRHLDIGTAKITEEEKEGIPHHLFGVVDPEQEVTIAWYKDAATKVIEEILARGNVPVLVGGSMLYLSAVIDGLEPLPAADPAVRQRLEAEYDQDGGESLYKRLQELDPETASAFHQNNKPYVLRALEIFESTGEAPSTKKKQSASPYDLLIFGMYWEREEITKRIEGRTPLLLKNGWIDEVQRLQEMGYTKETPAMKSHGYREVLEALENWKTGKLDAREFENSNIGESEMRELEELINAKTRQYAKRQMTWWKHDERIHWVDAKRF